MVGPSGPRGVMEYHRPDVPQILRVEGQLVVRGPHSLEQRAVAQTVGRHDYTAIGLHEAEMLVQAHCPEGWFTITAFWHDDLADRAKYPLLMQVGALHVYPDYPAIALYIYKRSARRPAP